MFYLEKALPTNIHTVKGTTSTDTAKDYIDNVTREQAVL